MENLILIISLIIYLVLVKRSIIFLLISTITTYFSARYNGKYKNIVFWFTIILNIILLILCRTLIPSLGIITPIGISYYTFMLLGYLIDTKKGKYEPEVNFIKYIRFILYIPCLFIGPINRYDDFKKSYSERNITINKVYNGLIRVCLGLFKKYIVVARLNIIVNTIINNNYNGAYVLLGCLLYSFLIYYDFSGGIDIVLGISNMFGISLKENFNTPYLSHSIKEFWNRWHITLSNWLKDYVYIPLGGNRCSKIRNKINIIITFLVSGIWHGLSYWLWGLINGILVAFTKHKDKYNKFDIVKTFIIVSFLWIFFIYGNTITSVQKFISIFYIFNIKEVLSNILSLGLNLSNIYVMIVSIIFLIIIDFKSNQIRDEIDKLSIYKKFILILMLVLIIMVFGTYGLGFTKSSFIYSKF